jgi:hypothetical protein
MHELKYSRKYFFTGKFLSREGLKCRFCPDFYRQPSIIYGLTGFSSAVYDHCAEAFSCEIATYKGSGKKFFEAIADPHTLDVCDHVMLGGILVVNIHHAIFQPQRLAHLLRNSSARSNVDARNQ